MDPLRYPAKLIEIAHQMASRSAALRPIGCKS